jgi:uncharacterized protein DUF4386
VDSRNATARRAGALYFLFMIVAIVSEFALGSFVVPGDAAATASKITASELTYRIDIMTGFVTLVVFIFVVATLYELLHDVGKGHARAMVLLVAVGVAFSLANMLNKFVPLVLLKGADYLSVFTKPQLDALALSSLRLHGSGAAISMAFWGLWLFPFGILVIKSGFLPRILGYLLLAAGVAYVVNSFMSLVLPDYRSVVSRFMSPLYVGEVPIIFWLLVKGATASLAPARSSAVG